MGILDERIAETAVEQLKCFGDACRTCKQFFACQMHWGDES